MLSSGPSWYTFRPYGVIRIIKRDLIAGNELTYSKTHLNICGKRHGFFNACTLHRNVMPSIKINENNLALRPFMWLQCAQRVKIVTPSSLALALMANLASFWKLLWPLERIEWSHGAYYWKEMTFNVPWVSRLLLTLLEIQHRNQ